MPETILVKSLAKALLLPPTGLLLVAVLGIAVGSRYPRFGRGLAGTALLAVLALSTPLVSSTLVRLVDNTPPVDLELARTRQAIVVLGGGVRRRAPEYGGDTLGRLTLERVRYAARIARLTHLPVLVSGGSVGRNSEREARLMRDALVNEFGVSVRWIEDRSRDTHENAVYSATLLRADGIHNVVLVAHSFDIPRATAEFARAGITILPAPTGIPNEDHDLPWDLVPGLTSIQMSYFACYEIAAAIVYRMRHP